MTAFDIRHQIPLSDIQAENDAISEELTEAVADAASSDRYIGGPVVEALAEELAEFCAVPHVVPCCNGTEALRLAILGVVGEGDGESEIITVSHTFPATLEAILAARHRPALVDVDPDTCLIDIECVEAALTKRTVAVIPVHAYGQMADIVQLRRWAESRGIAVIEHVAGSFGAAFDGLSPGKMSDAAAFDFSPSSNLAAWGNAGAIACRDAGVAGRIAQYVDHGRSDPMTHARIGGESRLDAIQAAVLRVKLRYVDEWNKARQRAAGWYEELFTGHAADVGRSRPGSRASSKTGWNSPRAGAYAGDDRNHLSTPQTTPGAFHVFNRYVIQSADRDAMRAALTQAGIATGIHHPIPCHEQPAYRFLNIRPDDLPFTHRLGKRILSLPMFPQLTRAQVERIVECAATSSLEFSVR